MKSIQLLYYYLEGSALFIQNKIWGRYFNQSTGHKFVSLSTLLLFIMLSYIVLEYIHLHIAFVVITPIILFLTLNAYLFSKLSNRTSEHKIKDFILLKTSLKWIYLIYTITIMLILPILIIAVLILNKLNMI